MENNQNTQEPLKDFFEYCPNFDRTIFVKFDNFEELEK